MRTRFLGALPQRLVQAGAVLATFGLWYLDHSTTARADLYSVPSLLHLAVAMTTLTGWVPRRRRTSPRVARRASVLALLSLLVTAAIAIQAAYWSAAVSAAELGYSDLLALLGLVYAVARYGRGPGAVAASGLLLAALGLVPQRTGTAIFGDTELPIVVGLTYALLGTAALGVGVYLRTVDGQRRRALEAVRSEQRTEFARDLHDFIAHHVTGIVVQAQGARIVAAHDPGRALRALEEIERAGAETMTSMRRMVGVLRASSDQPDVPLAPLASTADLPQLVDGFTSAGPARAALTVDGDLAGLPVEVSTSGYRVVMESLTNVRRHAPDARTVLVTLHRTADRLVVQVTNDGTTARPPLDRDRPGYGLLGLDERIRALGGTFSAGPGLDGGWTIEAVLPLENHPRALTN